MTDYVLLIETPLYMNSFFQTGPLRTESYMANSYDMVLFPLVAFLSSTPRDIASESSRSTSPSCMLRLFTHHQSQVRHRLAQLWLYNIGPFLR